MKLEDIESVFSIFNKIDPSPKTELKYINEFTLLVSIVLSAQATDISVNKATLPLFEIVRTPTEMIELGEENLKSYIKSIGLYNAKSKNIIALSKMLIIDFGSIIPDNYDDLLKLPGVGSKTARVFLNSAHNQPTIAVDTHVFRVSNRLGLANAKTATQCENILEALIPLKWRYYAHHWLILHGRYICKSRKPQCNKCKINYYCKYYRENLI